MERVETRMEAPTGGLRVLARQISRLAVGYLCLLDREPDPDAIYVFDVALADRQNAFDLPIESVTITRIRIDRLPMDVQRALVGDHEYVIIEVEGDQILAQLDLTCTCATCALRATRRQARAARVNGPAGVA